ncbi:MAG: hypothetical protein ACYDG6_06925 [Thermincolia bacterium]
MEHFKDLLGTMDSLAKFTIGETIKNIQTQYKTEDIKRRVRELPDMIYEQEVFVINLRQGLKNAKDALETAKDALKNAEAMIMFEIAEEKDEAGKAKFSNDAKRSAELVRRCKYDPDCNQAQETLRQAQRQYDDISFEIDKAQAEVKRLQDTYTCYLKTAGIVIAELTALSR